MGDAGPAKNTDRELYREPDTTGCGDFYSDSIHVTEAGGIGIDCGGYVIVKPLRDWHALAKKELPSPYLQSQPHADGSRAKRLQWKWSDLPGHDEPTVECQEAEAVWCVELWCGARRLEYGIAMDTEGLWDAYIYDRSAKRTIWSDERNDTPEEAKAKCQQHNDEFVGQMLEPLPPEQAAQSELAALREKLEMAKGANAEALAALDFVRGIIAEGAMTGFNCHSGDWAERLFASQAVSSRVVKVLEQLNKEG